MPRLLIILPIALIAGGLLGLMAGSFWFNFRTGAPVLNGDMFVLFRHYPGWHSLFQEPWASSYSFALWGALLLSGFTLILSFGQKLTESMGQGVVVENRPGASNNLGTALLAHAPHDGYTIGIVGGSHNINKFLFKNLGWDPQKSFEPIVYTHVVPLVFAINPQIPAKTLPELIAWMKAHPDDAKVATS